jgi:hypothetical protein
LVIEQVLRKRWVSRGNPPFSSSLSGCCSETEVSEQLYYNTGRIFAAARLRRAAAKNGLSAPTKTLRVFWWPLLSLARSLCPALPGWVEFEAAPQTPKNQKAQPFGSAFPRGDLLYKAAPANYSITSIGAAIKETGRAQIFLKL